MKEARENLQLKLGAPIIIGWSDGLPAAPSVRLMIKNPQSHFTRLHQVAATLLPVANDRIKDSGCDELRYQHARLTFPNRRRSAHRCTSHLFMNFRQAKIQGHYGNSGHEP